MAVEVGVKLRTLRLMYGLSQRELAKRAGVTNSTISMIEQGRVSPSVSSLEKVLSGIPMSLGDFFSFDSSVNYTAFFKPEDLVSEWHSDGVTSTVIAASEGGYAVTCRHFVYQPGAEWGSDRCLKAECELGFVVAGELALVLAGVEEFLLPGSAFHIKPYRPYRFRNLSTEDARLIVVSWP